MLQRSSLGGPRASSSSSFSAALGMNSFGYGGSAASLLPSFLLSKGQRDNHKIILFLICLILGSWTFYDICCHYHADSYASSLQRARASISFVPPASISNEAIASIPSPADLPQSHMFRNLDAKSASFANAAGVLSFPLQAEHVVAKTYQAWHIGTILPGKTRGNHLHEKYGEIIWFIQGRFLLRVAQLGNDGQWEGEDWIFEIGVSPSPFSSLASVVSSVPIGLEINPNVCHALRNIDEESTAVFSSYYVLPLDAKRDEPNREICRKQPKAFLADNLSLQDINPTKKKEEVTTKP